MRVGRMWAPRAISPRRCRSATGRRLAARSLGWKPFLLDFLEGDLYQKRLELRFVKYLHPDIKFPSTDDLVRQLHKDVADTRRIVSG